MCVLLCEQTTPQSASATHARAIVCRFCDHCVTAVCSTFTFDEARDALAHLEKGRATGKVVITVHNGAAKKDDRYGC